MNQTDMEQGLDYNTSREKMAMPEYGRNVLKMVQKLKEIPDRQKRSSQAAAVIKVMETLNPGVHQLENYEHKLWDQLYMIAGFDLDVDAPYPCPEKEQFSTNPVPLPMKDTKVKAAHYGRNIEKIINLLCEEEDSEVKTEMIRCLALYMRQQYLIWNKDSVSYETIFADIEKLSEGRVIVPEGLTLSKLDAGANFSRPGIGNQSGTSRNGKQYGKRNKGNFKNNKHR